MNVFIFYLKKIKFAVIVLLILKIDFRFLKPKLELKLLRANSVKIGNIFL